MLFTGINNDFAQKVSFHKHEIQLHNCPTAKYESHSSDTNLGDKSNLLIIILLILFDNECAFSHQFFSQATSLSFHFLCVYKIGKLPMAINKTLDAPFSMYIFYENSG